LGGHFNRPLDQHIVEGRFLVEVPDDMCAEAQTAEAETS
jgi:hypothetical protein